MPTRTTDRTPLVEYLRVQTDRDAEVVRALTAASEGINRELIRLGASAKPGKLVRSYQLRKAQGAIHRELATTWSRIGNIVEAGRAEAMAKAVELSFPDNLLANVLPEADRAALLDSLKASAGQGIVSLEHRLSGASYRPLATSVYHNAALAQGKVDTIVNNALARGASARELAADVREYIRPDVRGGMHYAAMRLARTELNNAFHAQQVLSAQKNPMIERVRWNLSGSHPRPDECNDFAEHGGDGLWRPEEVPGKPHPHCLCYMTDELPDRAEFIKRYEAGAYDDFLTENGAGEAAAPVAGPLAGVRRIKPRTYKDAATKANPGYEAGAPYQNNCHYVVNAMEMQARGYSVTAAPTYGTNGRHVYSIEQDWIVPSVGKSRTFSDVSFGYSPTAEDMANATAYWPNGARGFVTGAWKNADSAHIFSVYKDNKGVLRYVDGQPGRVDASDNLERMTRVKILRVDDLEPVERRVADSVTTSKVQPVATYAPEQKARLIILIKQWEEDVATIPDWNPAAKAMRERLVELQNLFRNYYS